MDTVSILVPVYNVEKYLAASLDSLVSQTYKDLEIILINDGSTDGSLKIAEEYAAKYPFIKIYSYENSGISKTRNRALEKATSNYVLFADSDDLYDKEAVEVMMEVLKANDADICMCGFVMDYPLNFKLFRKVSPKKVYTNKEALHALVTNQGINNYPWAKLFKKSCFDGIKFPEDFKGFEDTYTIFKAIAKAKRVVCIPDRFYHYIQRSGSLTNNMSYDFVTKMRTAYHYQEKELKKMFPDEKFDFNMQYYNTDMVLIYTLIVFSRRKDHPEFTRDNIDFSRMPFFMKWAYEAWLSIACLKLGWRREDIAKEVDAS